MKKIDVTSAIATKNEIALLNGVSDSIPVYQTATSNEIVQTLLVQLLKPSKGAGLAYSNVFGYSAMAIIGIHMLMSELVKTRIQAKLRLINESETYILIQDKEKYKNKFKFNDVQMYDVSSIITSIINIIDNNKQLKNDTLKSTFNNVFEYNRIEINNVKCIKFSLNIPDDKLFTVKYKYLGSKLLKNILENPILLPIEMFMPTTRFSPRAYWFNSILLMYTNSNITKDIKLSIDWLINTFCIYPWGSNVMWKGITKTWVNRYLQPLVDMYKQLKIKEINTTQNYITFNFVGKRLVFPQLSGIKFNKSFTSF